MKKSTIAGAVIAVLAGLNLVQGATLASLYARAHLSEDTAPIGLATDKVADLPVPAQTAVKASLDDSKPELSARLTEVRRARHDLVRYISSARYNRREAERRFADLRRKSDQAQMVAQDMLLDAADTLPPEQRESVVSTIDADTASAPGGS